MAYALIQVDNEWGEFFWRDQMDVRDDRTVYRATFAVVSSYGVFGYNWTHMGVPWHKFAFQIAEDYLLNKISQMVDDDDASLAKLRAQLDERLADGEISADYHNELVEELETCSTLVDVRDSDVLEGALNGFDWDDLPVSCWPGDAQQFVRKLWPAFVVHLQELHADPDPL